MSQISKCPTLRVVLGYWEALGEVSERRYKNLLYYSSQRSYCSIVFHTLLSTKDILARSKWPLHQQYHSLPCVLPLIHCSHIKGNPDDFRKGYWTKKNWNWGLVEILKLIFLSKICVRTCDTQKNLFWLKHSIIGFVALVFSRGFKDFIYNGKMVFNRLLGNGWSDLDDFSADMNICAKRAP